MRINSKQFVTLLLLAIYSTILIGGDKNDVSIAQYCKEQFNGMQSIHIEEHIPSTTITNKVLPQKTYKIEYGSISLPDFKYKRSPTSDNSVYIYKYDESDTNVVSISNSKTDTTFEKTFTNNELKNYEFGSFEFISRLVEYSFKIFSCETEPESTFAKASLWNVYFGSPLYSTYYKGNNLLLLIKADGDSPSYVTVYFPSNYRNSVIEARFFGDREYLETVISSYID